MTIDKLFTQTSVQFSQQLKQDIITFNDSRVDRRYSKRIVSFLDVVREMGGDRRFAKVDTNNNFLTASGLASSSSGFAALALSASRAVGLNLSQNDLSALARRGSGSAARSIHGGFVELVAGDLNDGCDSTAKSIADMEFWPITIVIAITSETVKEISSKDGMNHTANTSPFYSAWIESTNKDLSEMRTALLARDIVSVGELMEHSCLKMHGLTLSSRPGLVYWNRGTIAVIEAVKDLRRQGHPVYFTIDAGPHVKVICEKDTQSVVGDALLNCSDVLKVITTQPGPAARLMEG